MKSATTTNTLHVLVGCILVVTSAQAATEDEAIKPAPVKRQTPIDFTNDVLPIFRNNCLACHNSSTNENDLILETAAATIKGGSEGAGIIPGKPDESLVYKVAARAAEPVMPPLPNDVRAKALSPEELGILRQWIVEGAKSSQTATAAIQWKPINSRLKAVYSVAFDSRSGTVAASRANTISTYNLHREGLRHSLIDPSLGSPPRAHLDVVQSLAMSPDGVTLASGGYKVVKLWRRKIATRSMNIEKGIANFAMSSDGQLAIATANHEVHVYPEFGTDAKQIASHTTPITAITFAADDSVVSADETGELKRTTADGKTTSNLKLPIAPTSLAATSRFVVAGIGDGRLLWTSTDLKSPVKEMAAHKTAITTLTSGSQPHIFVAAGSDGAIAIVDLNAAKLVHTLNADKPVVRLAASPDKKMLAAISESGKTLVWQFADGKQLCVCQTDTNHINEKANLSRQIQIANRRFNHRTAQVKAAKTEVDTQTKALKAASDKKPKLNKQLQDAKAKQAAEYTKIADAKKQATEKPDDQSAKARLESLEKNYQKLADAVAKAAKELAAAEQDIQIVTQSLDRSKKTLATREAQQKQEEVRRAERKKEQTELKSKPLAQAVAVSFASNTCLVTLHEDGTQRSWAPTNGTPLSVITLGDITAGSQATSDNAHTLIQDGNTLRSITSEWKLHALIGNGTLVDRATSLDFSPDGSVLAVGSGQASRSGQLQLFNVESGKLERDFPNAHSDTVLDIQFSPDGSRLLTCGADKFAHIWDAETGEHIRSFEGHTHHVLTASWQPDMTHVATGGADNLIKVWNAETGEQKRTIKTFRKHVTRLRFAGSADTFFASSGDRTVRSFTASNGRAVRTFGGSTDFVHTLEATDDESVVLVGDEAGTVRLWNGKDSKQLKSFGATPQ